MQPPTDLRQALAKGAFWTITTRWGVRLLGLINTIVLARLLVPSDYGLVAMAMLFVAFAQAVLDFGAPTVLLRKATVSTEEANAAWSLGVLEGVLIGLGLALAAPWAALWFDEPRVAPILLVIGMCVACAYCGNIGMVLAQREFNYALGFRHSLLVKLIGMAVSILAALIWRDYRALVAGIAAGYLAGLFLSYAMHAYRPRWNTSEMAGIWAVGKWLMFASVSSFLARKSDELIASRVGDASGFGLYGVGGDLGQMPVGEVGPAMLKAFMPVLSSMGDDWARMRAAVIKTLAAQSSVVLPVGVGFAMVAQPATALLLGPGWDGAVPFVAGFALVSTVSSIFSPLHTLLMVRGHARALGLLVWLELLVFLIFAAVTVPMWGLLGLIMARGLSALANGSALMVMARQRCELPVRRVLSALVRPLAGVMLMTICVHAVWQVLPDAMLSVTQLIVLVTVGVLSFSAWCLSSWQLMGRPDGLEATLLELYRSRRGSRPGMQ